MYNSYINIYIKRFNTGGRRVVNGYLLNWASTIGKNSATTQLLSTC